MRHALRLAGCAVLTLMLTLTLGLGRLAAADEIIDRVLAVVAGDLIMLSDVRAAQDLHLLPVSNGGDAVREILPRLIDRSLILAEVERYVPPEPDAASLNSQLDAVRGTFATPQEFAAALRRAGLDEQRLREALRQDLRIRAYLDQRFTVASAGDEELGQYYRQHPDMFTERGRLTPYDVARPQIVEAVRSERRRALVDEWVAGLRRRAQILDLSETPAPDPAASRQ
jgi:hypothetical protein